MRPITLLVDLDGVLRTWPKDHAELERAHGLPAGSIAATAFAPGLIEQAITGRISDEAWRNEVALRLGLAHPASSAREAIAEWSAPVGAVHSEVLALIIAARRQCSIGLVTNGTDRLLRDLEALRLVEHLDFIINSSELGFAKPRAEYFLHALQVAGARPEEALFVDDSPGNVAAASALGIRSHDFSSAQGLRAFLQASGLMSDKTPA